MGTSLSGLTPATTFDGLLKVGDNDPLTADLKAISTGDGTDTMLELSTTALQIGGATGMYWDNTNSRLGVGTDSPNTKFEINGGIRSSGAGTQLFEFSSASLAQFRTIFGSVGFRLGSGMFVGGADGGPAASTRMHIKGRGADSTTTSLLVQNNDGADMLKVTDDGSTIVSNILSIVRPLVPSQKIDINANFNTIAAGIRAGGNNKDFILSATEERDLYLSTNFNTSITQVQFALKHNQGVFIADDASGSMAANTKLHIKGSGTDNTTASLLVQNSAGAELFKVQDDGRVDFGSLFASGTNIYGTNSSFRISIGGANEYQTYDSHIFKTYDGAAYSEAMRILGNGASTKVGIGETTPTARLHIKGSGNDNTTTSLLVQNSDASASLTYDDAGKVEILGNSQTGFIQTYAFGAVGFGNESGPTIIYGKLGGGILNAGMHTGSGYTAFGANSSSSQRVLIKGSGSTSATFALKAQNSGGETMFSVRDDKTIQMDGSRFTFNSSAFTSYADILLNTDLAVGTTTIAANTRAHIKGSGATSATTALLVENSAGTDLLKVEDGGTARFSGQIRTTSGNAIFNGDLVIVEGRIYNSSPVKGELKMSDYNLVFGDTGDTTPTASAAFQVNSTARGFLPPRMTETQRDAITSPAAGLMVYDTSNNQMNYWNGTTWIAF